MPVHSIIDSGVATITIDRQESLNALDIDTAKLLEVELIKARDNDSVRVIVLTGAGNRAFCAGADLKNTGVDLHPTSRTWTSSDEEAGRSGVYVRLMNIERLQIWKPLVAAINGHCIGGGLEIALQCDLRVATATSTFSLPEVKVGSIAGVCGSLLVRALPSAIAMKMLLTGMRIDAIEALRIGLVSDVWPANEFRDRVTELAQLTAKNAPLSLYATKRLAKEVEVLPRPGLFNLTEMTFGMIKGTVDRAEGRRAFAEKRTPRFVGK